MTPVPTATSLPCAGTLVPLAVAGLLAIVLLAMLIHRRPEALPLLVTAALPFRLPISADGRTVNLLIPLYVVVAAGIVVRLLAILRGRGGDPAARSVAARDGADPAIRGLQWVLLGAVVLYVLQISYSPDRAKAAENVAFFYVPFGLLFVLLRDVPWTSSLLLALPRPARGDRDRAGGSRVRGVRTQEPVPEPKAGRRQPVRQLLPGQLGVLRPAASTVAS